MKAVITAAVIGCVIIGALIYIGQMTHITGSAHFDVSFNEDAERNAIAIAEPGTNFNDIPTLPAPKHGGQR